VLQFTYLSKNVFAFGLSKQQKVHAPNRKMISNSKQNVGVRVSGVPTHNSFNLISQKPGNGNLVCPVIHAATKTNIKLKHVELRYLKI
jgi:hypothetical protein